MSAAGGCPTGWPTITAPNARGGSFERAATGHALPRYEVSAFPSPEQLDAMAQAQALRAAAS